MNKIEWSGIISSVQPRIRLNRSFDERSHTYLGYSLRISGFSSDGSKEFWVGVGKGAHEKHQFRTGMIIEGKAHPIQNSRKETVDYYKVSGIRIVSTAEETKKDAPPWCETPPKLETYRERGHRRLAKKTYEANCISCIWGCEMPVIITVDHWNAQNQQFRFETFCYGPKSCRFYKSGPTRKVKGRNGMTWEEEDWVDEDAIAHRRPDD